MKRKNMKKIVAVAFFALLLVSTIVLSVTAVDPNQKVDKDSYICLYDEAGSDERIVTHGDHGVQIIDISFGFGKVIATVENTGDEIANNVKVRFYCTKGGLELPIGDRTVTVSPGEKVDASVRFLGLGFYDFTIVVIGGNIMNTKGLWLLFFGLESSIIPL